MSADKLRTQIATLAESYHGDQNNFEASRARYSQVADEVFTRGHKADHTGDTKV